MGELGLLAGMGEGDWTPKFPGAMPHRPLEKGGGVCRGRGQLGGVCRGVLGEQLRAQVPAGREGVE